MAGGGWNLQDFRRQCVIPPDQLRMLNELPGWARSTQVRDGDCLGRGGEEHA